MARGVWSKNRQTELNKALLKSQTSPDGEQDPSIVSLRRMVDQVDQAVAMGVFGICLIGKAEADLVHNAYLCANWSGAEGSSLATSGTSPDKLPEELRADMEAEAKKNLEKSKK